MIYLEFSVGDIVRVVDKPYRDCRFGWSANMTAFCGNEYLIRSKEWYDRKECYLYRLSGLDGAPKGFLWCAGCFEQSMPEFEIADESGMKDLFGLT